MKKTDFILIGVVVLILILSIFLINGKDKKNDKDSTEEYLKKITYTEYEELINKGEQFTVIIERTGCSYCELYMPIVEKVTNEYKTVIYYIDTETLTDDEFNKLNASNDYLSSNEWGTPTTLLLKGNTTIDSIGGYVEKDEIVTFLKDNGIIE